jgi:hypothetical protein
MSSLSDGRLLFASIVNYSALRDDNPASLVADHKLRIHLGDFLSDQPVLQSALRIRLQVKRDGPQLPELRGVCSHGLNSRLEALLGDRSHAEVARRVDHDGKGIRYGIGVDTGDVGVCLERCRRLGADAYDTALSRHTRCAIADVDIVTPS